MKQSGRVAFSCAFMTAALAMTSPSALAQSAGSPVNSNFAVQVTVDKGCSVTPPADFDFGPQNQTPWVAKRQSGSMRVTCTKGTPYDITFRGLNDGELGYQRYMTSASSSSRILYYIRKNDYFGSGSGGGIGLVLGDTSAPTDNRIVDVGTGVSQSHTLYLIIDQGSWTRAGNVPNGGRYSDRVTAQVTF